MAVESRLDENLDRQIQQAYSDLKDSCQGNPNDYFGLLYFERRLQLSREVAKNLVAFGNNDFGFDGYFYDESAHSLYLFQFKNSSSHQGFRESMRRIIDQGFKAIFARPGTVAGAGGMIDRLRTTLIKQRFAIRQIFIEFIFRGDPQKAENSEILQSLREEMENKRYIIDDFFGENKVEFFLPVFKDWTGDRLPVPPPPNRFEISFGDAVQYKGAETEVLHLGKVPLIDLVQIYRALGSKFLEKNIRFQLTKTGGKTTSTNRVLQRVFRSMLQSRSEDPRSFLLNHNGITVAADKVIKLDDNKVAIFAPRLLNGAQTVTTYFDFLDETRDNKSLHENLDLIASIQVLCQIISGASPETITKITVANNRQNPVEPWQLRATDEVQLRLKEWFRETAGIYYENQQGSFDLGYEELEEQGYSETGKIELTKLARTYLSVDGAIGKILRFREQFEEENAYRSMFNEKRLDANIGDVILCYKVIQKASYIVRQITESVSTDSYAFVRRGRDLSAALACQAVLNDPSATKFRDEFGARLIMSADFNQMLRKIAVNKLKPLLKKLISLPEYLKDVEKDNFSFLRANAAFDKAMSLASKDYKWVKKRI